LPAHERCEFPIRPPAGQDLVTGLMFVFLAGMPDPVEQEQEHEQEHETTLHCG
jgi:hypothetical protein